MEVTEKLYIEWLERMGKKYKEDLCDHCPKEMSPREIVRGYGCDICDKLTKKYMKIKGLRVGCPCHYFRGDEDINMVKVAWKIIRGWKKDNKEG